MNKQTENKSTTNLLEPIIITIFGFLLLASPILFGNFQDNIEWQFVFRFWKDYLPLVAIFLINRFLLVPKLLLHNRRLPYFISVGGVIMVMVIITFLFRPEKPPHDKRIPPEGMAFNQHDFRPPPREHEGRKPFNPPPKEKPGPIPPYINLLILSILVVGFDTGLKVSIKWAQTEREKIKLEKENVSNQLAFLRNQVSPHFFMNTLNNIHSLIDVDKEEAKESIIKLSKLMRHLLYESEVALTPIKKEIDFIKSYVNLMRLRYSDKVKISIKLPANIPDKQIPPLLFTSLLENAFKHGISYDEESFINIAYHFTNDKLNFEIRNSIPKEGSMNSVSGIGIENTKKRLALIYKDDYELEITDNGKSFIVNMTIPI